MFRALQGFVDMDYSSYQQGQADKFTKQLANPYMSTSPNLNNSAKALMTVDPNTRRADTRNLELEKYALNPSKALLSMSQVCKLSDIDSLIGSQNYGDTLRCGWIYTKGNPGDQPTVSKGELGTSAGPVKFVDHPKGKWFWDLEKAKKEILADRCAALTSCTNVGHNNYANCAFSIDRGVGVPVDKNGQLLYPNDAKLRGMNLVTSSGNCPPPPAPGTQAYLLAKSRDVCMPNPDGTLSRDCMLQQITAAGCSTDGSLYYNLINYAQPKNYAAGLQNQHAFNTYQRNAPTSLMAAAIKDGSTTIQAALGNFKKLADEASLVKETSLNYAARDLCTESGIMDDYDFCSELTDTTPSPFALDCLQKYVGKEGGQPAGLEYPSLQTISKWNSLPNWGAVKAKVVQYKRDMNSKNADVQYKALQNFLGIKPQVPTMNQISAINGVEDLWFSMANNTFLGRRITTEGAQFPSIQSTLNPVGGTGLNTLIQYVTMANLRPLSDKNIRLRMETDDGSLWVLNKDINPPAYRNKSVDTGDTFSRYWDQPPTRYDAQTCWNLVANGPNYIMGTWQQSYGYSHSQTYYSDCSTNNFQRIPSEWMTLVQEPDAPHFSWECLPTSANSTSLVFREFRLPSLFPLNSTGPTSIVNTDVFPKLTGGLKFSRGGIAISPNNFATNSWRTLTVAATIDIVPAIGMYRFLEFGNLTIDIFPGSSVNVAKVVFNWNNSSLNTNTSGGIVIEDIKVNIPILFYVNMRSDKDSKYPNRLTCSASPLSRWQSGDGSLSRSDQYVKTLTTTNQAALYNMTDSARLILGVSPNQNYPSNTTANFTIGWVHMFDYELDSSDVGRDAKNAWNRSVGV